MWHVYPVLSSTTHISNCPLQPHSHQLEISTCNVSFCPLLQIRTDLLGHELGNSGCQIQINDHFLLPSHDTLTHPSLKTGAVAAKTEKSIWNCWEWKYPKYENLKETHEEVLTCIICLLSFCQKWHCKNPDALVQLLVSTDKWIHRRDGIIATENVVYPFLSNDSQFTFWLLSFNLSKSMFLLDPLFNLIVKIQAANVTRSRVLHVVSEAKCIWAKSLPHLSDSI